MSSRYQEVLHGAAYADVELPLIGVCNRKPSGLVREYLDLTARNVEFPGLCVLARWRQYGIIQQELQFFIVAAIYWKIAFLNLPSINRGFWLK